MNAVMVGQPVRRRFGILGALAVVLDVSMKMVTGLHPLGYYEIRRLEKVFQDLIEVLIIEPMSREQVATWIFLF
jgi:hypothetical protein